MGSLQSQFDKVFSSKFDGVIRTYRIHIVLYGNELLSDEDNFVVKCNTKKLLVYNKWNNPNLWRRRLPKELNNRSSSQDHALKMDCVILIPVRARNFSVYTFFSL